MNFVDELRFVISNGNLTGVVDANIWSRILKSQDDPQTELFQFVVRENVSRTLDSSYMRAISGSITGNVPQWSILNTFLEYLGVKP